MNNDNKDPLLLDHDYDGIQELDNKLPRWWVWLFNLCIVFAVIYFVYYHVLGKGALMASQYQAEMKIGDQIKMRAVTEFESNMASLTPSADAVVLAEGKQTFT